MIMELLIKNLKWILLVIGILILSNYLTGTHFKSLSKKDKKKGEQRLDSLAKRFKQFEFIHVQEAAKIRKIFLEDSLLKLDYQRQLDKDKTLIQAQRDALNKFKNLPSKVNLSKLDSAYEAENP